MATSRSGVGAVKVSPELWTLLSSLEREHKFWRWIDAMKTALLYNRTCGESIAKKRIPDYYVRLYGVNNLYRYSHSEGYRSCYTLLRNVDGIIDAIILDLLTHHEYENRFGYKM